MPSFFLLLDSGRRNPSSGDFRTEWEYPVILEPNVQYEVGLVNLNCWYSWSNIYPTTTARVGTDTFRYFNGLVWSAPYQIPEGQYSIVQIESYIHSIMKINGDFTSPGGVDTYDILITPNFSTLKVDIQVTNGYQLDLSLSRLNELFGWPSTVVAVSGSGTFVADITDGINALVARLDIVENSFIAGSKSDAVRTFVPNKPPGTNIDISPENIIYLPINKRNQIHNIRSYITDNQGRPIDFRSEPVTFTLELRPVR